MKKEICAIYLQKKTFDVEGNIVDHFPVEVSRITKFLMDPGARMTATLRPTYYHQSPLMQGGLEIPCSIEVHMSCTTPS